MTLRRWFKKLVEKIGWIVPLGMIACHGGGTGACTPTQRAAISARFITAVEAACDHSKPLAECASYEPLKKQYEAERKVWKTCSMN